MTDTKQKQQRTFDIAAYSDKVKAALAKMEATQKPGEQTGLGSKSDVLSAAKTEIKAMLAKGYTAKQISDALKDDVFAVLPKTITELIGTKKATKQRTSKATNAVTSNKPKAPAGAPAAGAAGTINAKQDTENL